MSGATGCRMFGIPETGRNGWRLLHPIFIGLAFWLSYLAPITAHAEQRVALVVGNADYEHAGRLPNPTNDAEKLGAILKDLGFDVIVATDLSADSFANTLQTFSKKLSGADVGLFFYAGHGLQHNSTNYLVPIDAKLENEFQLKQQTIELGDVLDVMRERVAVSLVFLDACRNNPLSERLRRSLVASGRSVVPTRGLARINLSAPDMLVAYAAVPGEVAEDGTGENSPFTSALLRHIKEPGVEIEVLMKRVQFDVRRATKGRQEPERLSRLSTEFYFAKPEAGQSSAQTRTQICQAALADSVKEKDLARTEALGAVFAGTPCGQDAKEQAAALRQELKAVQAAKRLAPNSHAFKDCDDCPEVVVVPAGSFAMGSPPEETGRYGNEGPRRDISVPQPFALMRHEVTRGQWRAFVKDTRRPTSKDCRALVYDKSDIAALEAGNAKAVWKATGEFSWENTNYTQDDTHPVACISYFDALDYAAWLSKRTGHTYRLPSEAEWEYAARGDTDTPFSTGYRIRPSQANYHYPTSYAGSPTARWRRTTTPVGTFEPNRFGLHDMHGNVWEWVGDCAGAPLGRLDEEARPFTSKRCDEAQMRGGAFWTAPHMLRSAYRYQYDRKLRGAAAGFRLLRELPADDPQLVAAKQKSQAKKIKTSSGSN